MKIVINGCYGGFGLSTQAIILAIERGSAFVQKYKQEDYSHSLSMQERIKVGDYEIVEWLPAVLHKDGMVYSFDDSERSRNDPVLIGIVEELGKAASGKYSELRIVEVPDDAQWEIQEYDGMEHVAEQHRTWG